MKTRKEIKLPLQPTAKDEHGRIRFVKNDIVDWLMDNAYDENGEKIDMNKLAMQGFGDKHRTQFASLIGYSVEGFGSLSYVSDSDYNRAIKTKKAIEAIANQKIAKVKKIVNKLVHELHDM
jgi:hypothetical protein